MQWARLIHSAAKAYVVQVRCSTRVGARSSLKRRTSESVTPGASSTLPSACSVCSAPAMPDASYHNGRFGGGYGLRPNIRRTPFHMRRILSENLSSPRRKPLFASTLWPRLAICVEPAAGWKP